MMEKIVGFILLLSISLPLFGQTLLDGNKIEVQAVEGRFNGPYTSYHLNGQLKAQGQLEDNQPTGEWSLWDEDGNLRMKRLYHSPLKFELLFPEPPTDGPAALFGQYDFTPKRDSLGSCIDETVEESDILYERRYYRAIAKTEDNKRLFHENTVQDLFFDLIESEEPEGDVFDVTLRSKLDKDELLAYFDLSQFELQVIQIKEVQFFSVQKMMMETRILAVRPVFFEKGDGKRLLPELWFYYPYIKNRLAEKKIQMNDHSEIQNYDDLLAYKYFSSTIFKYSNIHDKPLSEFYSGKELIFAQRRAALEQYDQEHNLWIEYYNGGKDKNE